MFKEIRVKYPAPRDEFAIFNGRFRWDNRALTNNNPIFKIRKPTNLGKRDF